MANISELQKYRLADLVLIWSLLPTEEISTRSSLESRFMASVRFLLIVALLSTSEEKKKIQAQNYPSPPCAAVTMNDYPVISESCHTQE